MLWDSQYFAVGGVSCEGLSVGNWELYTSGQIVCVKRNIIYILYIIYIYYIYTLYIHYNIHYIYIESSPSSGICPWYRPISTTTPYQCQQSTNCLNASGDLMCERCDSEYARMLFRKGYKGEGCMEKTECTSNSSYELVTLRDNEFACVLKPNILRSPNTYCSSSTSKQVFPLITAFEEEPFLKPTCASNPSTSTYTIKIETIYNYVLSPLASGYSYITTDADPKCPEGYYASYLYPYDPSSASSYIRCRALDYKCSYSSFGSYYRCSACYSPYELYSANLSSPHYQAGAYTLLCGYDPCLNLGTFKANISITGGGIVEICIQNRICDPGFAVDPPLIGTDCVPCGDGNCKICNSTGLSQCTECDSPYYLAHNSTTYE